MVRFRKLVLPLIGAILFALLCTGPNEVNSKSQYVEPLSMGMKMSLPYDIANMFNRPIAGVSSVVLTVGLAAIIFFGMITAPFGYFFGVPSRKLVLGGAPSNNHRHGSPRMSADPWDDLFGHIRRDQNEMYPSLTQTMLYLFEQNDLAPPDCTALVLCYAHGVLQYLPQKLIKAYAVLSKKICRIPDPVQNAIIRGIGDNSECEQVYSRCPDSVFSLSIKTLRNFLPDSVKGDNFRKRKGAMYL